MARGQATERSINAAPDALLDRDAQLSALVAACERASHGAGAVVCLSGAAGIGKSALLEAAAALARERGLVSLSAAAGELERGSSFAVMRQLLEPALRRLSSSERDRLLAGAAAPAAGLLRLPAAVMGSEEPAALEHALFWLVANLAERTPLALVVDDAHWCDRASLRALVHLALRTEHEPIALIVASRPGEPDAPQDLLDRLASVRGATWLSLPALSEAAATRLVRERLPGADDEFCRAAFDATAGNPFYLRELRASVAAAKLEPTAKNAPRLRSLGTDALVRSVILRLQRLSEPAAEVARWLSVLDDNACLAHMTALARLAPDEALQAVDALVATQILRPGHPLSFVHALVRTAIYESLARGERSRRHGAAARLLEQQGEPPQAVAAHLLRTAPAGDQETVARLRRAAQSAGLVAGPDAACAYLERALAEPPAPGDRAELLFMLGGSETVAGRPEATDHLRAALAAASDVRLRMQITRPLAGLLFLRYRAEEAVQTSRRVIDELRSTHPDLAHELEVHSLLALWVDVEGHPRRLDRLDELEAPLVDTSPVDRRLLARKAWAALMTGEPAATVRELARAAVAGGRLMDEDPYAPGFEMAIRALAAAGAIEEARAHLQAAIAEFRRRGWIRRLGLLSWMDAAVGLAAGEVGHAEESARQALELLDRGEALWAPANDALVDALVERGAVAEAWATLAEHGYDRQLPSGGFAHRLALVRGRLRVAGGDVRGGLEDLLAYGEGMQRLAFTGPAAGPWRSLAAIAHAQLGETRQARVLADEELELARRFDEAGTLGVALRGAGIVRGGDGIALLREAVAALARSEARLEHARALTDLGAALRRSGARDASRGPLREALEAAQRLGASALARRAREELLASGARPRRTALHGAAALTPSQRRVCERAAQGMTNRQIAQALFITQSTVENHLRASYRKLGVAGKAGLAAALRG